MRSLFNEMLADTMLIRSAKRLVLAVALVTAVGLVGCDSGAEEEPEEDVLVIEGARVSVNGNLSLEVNGNVVDGTLPVPLNGQTGVILVEFRDADGVWRTAESLETEYEVTYQFPDRASLSWEPLGASDHAFVLIGVKLGTSSFNVTIMDGRDLLYETPPLRVDVRVIN